MDPVDRKETIERYEARFREFGYSPETLGWGRNARQEVRFSVLAAEAIGRRDASVLDVGCGFADLFDYLVRRGWRGRYVGVDIVPALLNTARERHPDLDIRAHDISEGTGTLEPLDYVIASGIFNAKLPQGDNADHIRRSLKHMFDLSREAVCVDFMTSHVDYRQPGSWHTDPAWALNEALGLSRRVAVRLDYMPYEFALFIYRDATISDRNLFEACEAELRAEGEGSR